LPKEKKMTKSQEETARIREAKTTAKKGVMKKSGRKETAKKLGSKEATDVTVGTKKEYPKSKNVCRVTFRLPEIAVPDAKSVCIVGDFNDWNIHANRMKRLKNGDYMIKLELERGREYQFRYLIDETKWENDWNADKYVKSPYGDTDNSVIIV
jgi:1,4-alpha-glucan branching enzyme